MTDKDKIFAAVVICAATAVVSLAAGLAAERRSADLPQVEIIEAVATESKAVSVSVSEKITEASKDVPTTETTSEEKLMVNINTATADELDKLKGVGEATANAIIEYREQTPFESIEDIMKVKGIGEKKFNDIKDDICV